MTKENKEVKVPRNLKQTTYPQIQHHGAVTGVTGSCHRYLASDDCHLLVDCGLFQGRDARLKSERAQMRPETSNLDTTDDPAQAIEFDLESVRALIVTHVHIDHIGRLPYLIAAGFDGPIYCSKPTAHLLPLVIEDALKIGFTRNQRLIDLFLSRVSTQLVPLDYGVWTSLDHLFPESAIPDDQEPGRHLSLRLQPAGHILGSAYVELSQSTTHQPATASAQAQQSGAVPTDEVGTGFRRTVFSGDLGADHAPLLPPPVPPDCCHTLVIESTYGDRQHEDREHRIERLQAVLDKALANGGTVMIPAFSIGRTQELLYELESLINAREDPAFENLQIIVDSPLAARFTESYRALKPYWDEEARERVSAGRHPLSFDNLYTIDSHDEHLQTVDYLTRNRQPAVVLAASGMAAGGRIVNYLKAMLPDPVHDVLFVGYQAEGTPGRALQEAALQRQPEPVYIELDGEQIAVRAAIHTLGGYSAHADQKDLLNFASGIEGLEEIRIVHGDEQAKQTLKSRLENVFNQKGEEKAVRVWIPGPD